MDQHQGFERGHQGRGRRQHHGGGGHQERQFGGGPGLAQAAMQRSGTAAGRYRHGRGGRGRGRYSNGGHGGPGGGGYWDGAGDGRGSSSGSAQQVMADGTEGTGGHGNSGSSQPAGLDLSVPASASQLDVATRTAVDAYVARWGPLLQAELEEERRVVHERLVAWPLRRLQGEGLVLMDLVGRKYGTYFGKVVLRLAAANGGDLPYHRFGSGDLVALCRGNPLRERVFEALVMDRSRREVRLVADAPPPGLGDGTWRLDKGVNMTLYLRCAAALRSLYKPLPPLVSAAGTGAGARSRSTGAAQHSQAPASAGDLGVEIEEEEEGDGRGGGHGGYSGGGGRYARGGGRDGRGRGSRGQKRAHRQDEEEGEGLPVGTHLRDVLIAGADVAQQAHTAAALAAAPSPIMPQAALQWSAMHIHEAVAAVGGGGGPGTAPLAGVYVQGDQTGSEDVGVGLNASQEAGIALGMRHRVVLLQGPPGTGKTTTIVRFLTLLKRKFGLSGPVLAVAQSNVAVDNLLEGLVDVGIDAVRVGQPVKVRESLRDATLDVRLLDHPMQAEIDAAAERLREHMRRLPTLRGRDRGLGHRDASLMARAVREAREALTREVLGGAEVICATCVGAGGEQLAGISFPLVVLDEGSQVTEPEALIPLTKGASHVVLVGDHRQLPPVVLSCGPPGAAPPPLATSLFERLIAAGAPSALLQVQYRMHPALSAFPSWRFYAGRLVDGVPAALRPAPPGLPWPAPAHGPLMFVDVQGTEAVGAGGSKSNAAEVVVAVHVVKALVHAGMAPQDIGVVTPYAAQVQALSDALSRVVGVDGVEVKSVDGYQGREKEVVVLSCVRANAQGQVGFLEDRRLNVAVTRARRGLVLLGHARTLQAGDQHWAALLAHCEAVGCIVTADGLVAELLGGFNA